ncbi:MAG: hypothetical protein IJ578_10005 [Bacteroidales bacterium]|nr:hypothetical protein [Bacteroidales bacterium]
MKRIFAFLLGLLLCLSATGQAQITTKKEKLSDFDSKTLKVVLPGDPILDEALRQAAKNAWYLSPFETCTKEEFDRLRTSDNWYFLVTREADRKKEPGGVTFLHLLKGGGKKVDDMMDVARLALCPAGAPTGREAALLPALLETFQTYVKEARSSDFKRFGSAIGTLRKTGGKDVYLVADELSPQIGKDFIDKKFDEKIHQVDAATADAAVRDALDAIVAFCIYPAEIVKGASCYKYYVDARTHEILWYKQHKISGSTGAGLLKSDLNDLVKPR